MKRINCVVWDKYKKFKRLKYHIFNKTIICVKCGSTDEAIYKEKEWTEIAQILVLINNIENYQKVLLKKA